MAGMARTLSKTSYVLVSRALLNFTVTLWDWSPWDRDTLVMYSRADLRNTWNPASQSVFAASVPSNCVTT